MPPEQPQPTEYQYQQQPGQRLRQLPVKKLAIITGVVILVLLIVSWVVNNGYVEIATQNAGDEVSFDLKNQATGQSIKASGQDKNFKTTAKKGTYEALVRSGDKSYFSVVETQGFLKTTKLNAVLESEKARSFVGNDPDSCAHLLRRMIVSYECLGAASTLRSHIPATAVLPTYNKTNPYPSDDIIEAIVETKNGEDLLILYEVEVAGHGEFEPENASHHNAYRMPDSGIRPASGTPLTGLDEKLYSFLPYKDGFIAYDEIVSKILYYSKPGSKPTDIKPQTAEGLTPYSVTVDRDALVISYSKTSDEQEDSLRQSEIVVVTDNATKHFALDQTYGNVRLCGDDRLCAVNDEQLDVFALSGETATLSFSIKEVSNLLVLDDRLLAVKGKDVLSIDTASRSGYVEYSFGDHTFCGLYPAGDNYMVCASTEDGAKSLLLIDRTEPSDGIDKKVAGLLGIDEVAAVSAYGKFIFISPEAGKLEYRNEIGGYGYDPAILKTANDAINKKVDELGLDRKKYHVETTLK